MTILTVPDAIPAFAPSRRVERLMRSSKRAQQPQSSADLVSLAMGEPDFGTPSAVIQAAVASLDAGRTHYSPLAGEASLREAIAQKLTAEHRVNAEAADVLITHGGTAGLAAAILGIVNEGDRVVIPDPTYSLYNDLVSLAGGVVVNVPLGTDLHWNLPELEKALAGARLFVFCNPSNPTGIVHSRQELQALAGFVKDTETIIISDEAYADLTYTDEPFTSVLDLDPLRDRTIYCQTFSKSYAMTGWRIGYLYGPPDLIGPAMRVHNAVNGSVNTAVQDAALAALTLCGPDVEQMRQAYSHRRTLMHGLLAGIPGLEVREPEGAFYFFPRYDADIPAVELCAVLRESGVAVRPGSEFGPSGEGHLRLSYAASDEAIRIGVARLARAWETIRSSLDERRGSDAQRH